MSKSPDIIIGLLLVAMSIFGTISNIISFLYFRSCKTKNPNSSFFKILYLAISLNDAIFCVLVIPEIESLFSTNRAGTLFTNATFCSVWFVLHSTSYHVSIALLGVLSWTRLMLIKKPVLQFRPGAAYITAGLVAGIWALVYTVSIGLNLIYVYYSPVFIQCTFQCMDPVNTTRLYTSEDQTLQRFYSFFQYGFAVVCFFVVCISVLASLYYLRKSGKAAENIQGSQKHQREAGTTVILMTLLYLVFNFLTFLMYVFIMLDWIVLDPVEVGVDSVGLVMERMRSEMFDHNMVLNYYAAFVVTTFAACMNATVNPMLYYFRLNAFREFIHTNLHKGMDGARCFGKKIMDFQSKDSLEGKTCNTIVETKIAFNELAE